MGMERPPEVNFLRALRTAFDDFKISSNGLAHLVRYGSRLLVAYPGVNTSSARVHPQDVFEAEVVPQCPIKDLDRHGHKLPTLDADIGLVAARSDLVVVRQVDIEAQLLGKGLECSRISQCLTVAGVSCVDRADFKAGGHHSYNVFPETKESDQH